MKYQFLSSVGLVCWFSGTLFACDDRVTAVRAVLATSASDTFAGVPESEARSPYARGRWRLMTQEQLSRVVIYASHILIRHRELKTLEANFCVADWQVSSPPPQRTREEARALAQSLAVELEHHPERFFAYAVQHSEDLATGPLGGSLGGKGGLDYAPWGEVLDALSAIAPSQVSAVVETEYGFHIFLRRPPPARDTVSGSHLVIGYDQAGWLRNAVPRGPVPTRSRKEAFELAQSLADRARENPEQFSVLVDRYSEHRDAAAGGDLGEWATPGPSRYPREVEILATLPIGGVSQPIDSLFGVEILQRTPIRSRGRYAMNALVFSFDASVHDDDPRSRASILRLARAMAQAVANDASKFDELRASHCCQGTTQLSDGLEYPEVVRVLSQMKFGEIATEPIESGHQLLIPMRLDPETIASPQMVFDLAFSGPPDTSYFLSYMPPETAREELRTVATQAVVSLNVDATTAEALQQLHERPWAPELATATVEERQVGLNAFQHEVRALLGPADGQRYVELLEKRIEQLLLQPGD